MCKTERSHEPSAAFSTGKPPSSCCVNRCAGVVISMATQPPPPRSLVTAASTPILSRCSPAGAKTRFKVPNAFCNRPLSGVALFEASFSSFIAFSVLSLIGAGRFAAGNNWSTYCTSCRIPFKSSDECAPPEYTSP